MNILKILVELWAMQNNVEVEICGNWLLSQC